MSDQFSNFAVTTLAGGAGGVGTTLNTTDTTMEVASGAGAKFPSTSNGGTFMVALGSLTGTVELVKCTARATDTFTLARGQEGTAAVSWAVGTTVQLVVTAGSLTDLWAGLAPITFNAKNYGALCNGTTDDTSAIQAAINAAKTAGGGVVYLPGLCGITSPLALSANVTLAGVGMGSGVTPLSGFSGAEYINVTGNNAGVRDLFLGIVGSTTPSTTPAATGISLTGVTGTRLERLLFQAVNGYAVTSFGASAQANYNTDLANLRAYFCNGGFYLKGVSGSSFNGVHRLYNVYGSQTQTGDCIRIEDIDDTLLTNCFGECVAGSGSALHIVGACNAVHATNVDMGYYPGPTSGATVTIESSSNGSPNYVTIVGGIIEGGSSGVHILAGTFITLDDLHIYNNGTYGVYVTGGDSILLSGCQFEYNGSSTTGTRYDLYHSFSGTMDLRDCVFATAKGTAAQQVNYVASSASGASYWSNCRFRGTGFTAATIFNSTPALIRNCPGYNPLGQVSVTLPASGTAFAVMPFDLLYCVSGGTVSLISIGGNSTGLVSGTFRVPASQTFTITYSVAPTAVAFSD